jgi:hypothetical protein
MRLGGEFQGHELDNYGHVQGRECGGPQDHLSEHLDAVEQGEEVVICRRNIPFARITAIGS